MVGATRYLGVAAAVLVVFAAIQFAQAKSALTADGACTVLKARMARFYRSSMATINAAPTFGCHWDVLPDDGAVPGYFVIGLRSGRKCQGICSNLVGWYAVRKRDAQVREWNTADVKIGPILRDNQ